MNISREILSTLAYFDLFDYPLTKQEVYRYLQQSIPHPHFEAGLINLLDEMMVFRVGEFYSLHNDPSLSERRRKGNERAQNLLLKAEKIASLLAKFPFVEGVAVSGSLSKNFASEEADIDFFIITKSDRMWIARTFLHMYKKMNYLLGRQHFLCMNYFLDEKALTIREKNIYTATELVTLMPMNGIHSFERLYQENSWTSLFLPNNYLRVNNSRPIVKGWVSIILERMFCARAGDYFEKLFMNLTIRNWNNKTKRNKKNTHGFVMSLDAGRHYAKPNPSNFQQQLLDAYSFKIAHLANLYEGEMLSTEQL